VPHGKQRAVLAALLLKANRVVSLDELAEMLWGYDPPPSARVSIQNHVMRLRRTMGDEGSRVITQPPGYLIRVDDGELDVSRFQAYLDTARAAARDSFWDAAATAAQAALSLFRGEPLADVDSEALTQRETSRLAELRAHALETRIDADLHLGRHAEVIAELRQLTRTHPLREQLHSQLMLALYRVGRQAEALSAYHDARKILTEEVGTEPGAQLRELHQQILTADPALAVPESVLTAGDQDRRNVPRQLPAPVAQFAGRTTELAALTGLLNRHDVQMPGTLVISAIGGTAGVGKTALAVQWAHQVAEKFPGGQLYVNLRGYDPAQPMPAKNALAGFLRALGVPGQSIPPEEDERAAQYRSLLAGRRILVLLDNAGSTEQVRPLLPGTPSCCVVVTSRDSLAGLVARDGAARLNLDLLPLEDAVALLRALIGARVDADPGAAATLTEQCCRLPLALRIAAELAAARPHVSLAGLVDELAHQQRRLDLLDVGGDPRTAVRAVFSWSYRHLDSAAARAFRLAGLHPGSYVDPYAVAALTGATLEQSRWVLDVLARAHLIQQTGTERYGMHDLLRAYAGELAEAEDTDEDRRAAWTRLFDHYLHSAAIAMDVLHPTERHYRPRIPRSVTAPPVTDPAAARAWLDAERATLVTVTVYAGEHDWPAHAIQLSATLFRYLDTASRYPEAITIHSSARDAARRAGDHAAEASELNHLADIDARQGRYQQAIKQHRQALALFRQTGDRTGQAQVLGNLGGVYTDQGRYRTATSLHKQALDLFREIGDRVGEAGELINLGDIEERQGLYQEAARHHLQALPIAREIGSRHIECVALINLGTVSLRQDRYQQAAIHLQQALALCRDTGYRFYEAEALTRMGEVCLRLSDPQEATGHLQAALALYQQMGNRSGEAEALSLLGEVSLATGQPDHARSQLTTALSLAGQIGDKHRQARAHDGLGHCYQATGPADLARRHWRQALALFTEIGAPEAARVRVQLTTLENF